MADITPGMIFTDTLRNKKPDALAWIRGNAQNPQLSGVVRFYTTPYSGAGRGGDLWTAQHRGTVLIGFLRDAHS